MEPMTVDHAFKILSQATNAISTTGEYHDMFRLALATLREATAPKPEEKAEPKPTE